MRYARNVDFRFGDAFSAKHVWELNRHQPWVYLSKLCYLTGEQSYAQEINSQWSTWLDANPPLVGINWASGIELGLRLISWAYTAAFLHAAGFRPARWDEILASVHDQAAHIERHLSYGTSANNHLVAEASGLVVAGRAFKELRLCDAWAERGSQILWQTMKDQVRADGIHGEQALSYHLFVLDLWLISALVSQADGHDYPRDYWATLESMVNYIATVMDANGSTPRIGDDDDGRAVCFSPPGSANLARSQVATAAVLFDRGDLKTIAGEFDERSLWLLGVNGLRAFEALEAVPANLQSRAFTESGVYVLRNDRGPSGERVLVFDAGDLGLGATAAHGHADALSLTLSINGTQVLVDPGTYTYHTDARLRRYFRGTSAHNTIVIDDRDQSLQAGPTLWRNHARPTVLEWRSTPDTDLISASHDGYRRRSGIIHWRRVVFNKTADSIAVTDAIQGKGQHRVEIRFHIAPELSVLVVGPNRFQVAASSAILTLEIDACLKTRLLRGSDDPIGGWYSPRFGELLPCFTICGSAQLALPVKLDCRMLITDGSELQDG